ncbi:MAG: preprotein translocase subunit SecY [Clostridia bacterium]
MIDTLKNSFKIPEVRKKILITLLFVLIYRLGSFIPVPGISTLAFEALTKDQTSLFGIMNAITGGALSQGTLFAIGISPYINASIIIQLLTVAIPALERMSKEGEEGRNKINKITRYSTLGLALAQSLGILFTFKAQTTADLPLFNLNLFGTGNLPEWVVFIFVTLIFTAGSSLCMWIGERITEHGISNGISMLIFVGIIASGGQAIIKMIEDIITKGFIAGNGWQLFVFLGVLVLVFGFIVLVDGGERKIPVQYAKQVKGNKMYGGQSTYIPLKVNASGVLPLIFAFAILSLPSIIGETFFRGSGFAEGVKTYLQSGGWLYSLLLSILILAFAYFYSMITFNPADVSKNLQQNGGFVPGIRPGRQTGDYLGRVVKRITLYGAVFLAIMALVPSLIFSWIGGPENSNLLLSAFGATGMLIVVSVALEFDKALQQQIMMRHYKGFMK